jgi:twitching motility protein PilT
MSTIQIDRLLDTVVKLGASDLHLTVGAPADDPHQRRAAQPADQGARLRRHGALMKSITPERNQQELQEEGGTDFGFAYGDAARFRVSVFRRRATWRSCCDRSPTAC